MSSTIRTPGRNISVGEAVRRLNPHLFGQLEPETQAILKNVSVPGDSEKNPGKPKRLRQDPKPLLNKLESEFKEYWERVSGHKLFSQAVRFRLANGLWYKPDFLECCPTMGWIAIEVKGPHAFRGGFENLKMAATTYPDIRWRLVWKQDGKWEEQTILP